MSFPSIHRLTVYGRTRTAARIRKPEDLKAYGEAGLDRVHFGLESRLRSFAGQYGGLSNDISYALGPYVKGGRLDFSAIPDTEMGYTIRLIRSKLMP